MNLSIFLSWFKSKIFVKFSSGSNENSSAFFLFRRLFLVRQQTDAYKNTRTHTANQSHDAICNKTQRLIWILPVCLPTALCLSVCRVPYKTAVEYPGSVPEIHRALAVGRITRCCWLQFVILFLSLFRVVWNPILGPQRNHKKREWKSDLHCTGLLASLRDGPMTMTTFQGALHFAFFLFFLFRQACKLTFHNLNKWKQDTKKLCFW